jgi:DHA1 family inner membrane transport protein
VLVAGLSVAGLAGVAVFCPKVPHDGTASLRGGVAAIVRPAMLLGLLAALLAFTGFVAAFAYVAPMLREVAGLSSGWVGGALVVYGLGTIAGNAVAGRVAPRSIARVLPAPVAALAALLLLQGATMRNGATAVIGLFLMGASAFVVAPLLQTWLMGEAGPAAAGLAAAVNISVFGLAAALGAGLGGLVISTGLGLDRIGPVAALPVLASAAAAWAIAARARRRPAPAGALDAPPAPARG